MSSYYLFHDDRKCISCRACQVQCKVNKGLGVGPKTNQIIEVGPEKVDGRPRAAYVFMSCFHCEKPWCLAACPSGAIQKRSSDGIIFIDPELCVGCKSCVIACPWSAPQWDLKKGIAVKCDYCKDRVDAGMKPACVTACPTDCLIFDTADHIPDAKRVRFARDIYSHKSIK